MQRVDSFSDLLALWSEWLARLTLRAKVDGDLGSTVKYQRQLQAVSDTLYGAASNVKPLLELARIYDEDMDSADAVPAPRLPHYYSAEYAEESSSRAVVDGAVAAEYLYLIQGPPGTGKTTAIAEIVAQTLSQDPGARIAIASETHVAVDNALERLAALMPEAPLTRYPRSRASSLDGIGSDRQIDDYAAWLRGEFEEVAEPLLAALDLEKRGGATFVETFSICGVTCNHLARLGRTKSLRPWDLVIVDEVSKATLPEVLIPLLQTHKAVLVGDPAQLPPVFCQEEREEADAVEEQLAERLLDNRLVDRAFDVAPPHLRGFLETQYRMVDPIGSVVSACFYGGLLKNGRGGGEDGSVRWLDYKPAGPVPAKQGGALANPQEVTLVRSELEALQSESLKDVTVAVLTPYRAQKQLLEEALREDWPFHLDVSTIDEYQGRQAEIVFISMTRTVGSARFYADPRRLNVAFSRARDRLYVVGASSYLLPKLKRLKLSYLAEIYSCARITGY